MTKKTAIFTERLDLSEATLLSESRAVENVILIKAGMSLNRRRYSESVLLAAAPLFEGVKAYNDHGFFQKVTDITGWYTNVRFEAGALRGTRHFTRNQAGQDVYAVVEDILNKVAPASLAGLSISAVGKGREAKGPDGEPYTEVEAITAAHSVDDVTEPAAGGAYLAASNRDFNNNRMIADVLKAMTFDEWFQARPEYVKRVMNELKTMRESEGLKAARAEAEHNRAALLAYQDEARRTLASAERAREAAGQEADRARSDLAQARRELALEKALRRAKLPAVYEADLRDRLLALDDESGWDAILQTEQQKASAAGHRPRVPVSGAGPQMQAQRVEPPGDRYRAPADPERATRLLRQRLAAAQSPDEQLRILQSFQS